MEMDEKEAEELRKDLLEMMELEDSVKNSNGSPKDLER